MAAVTMLALGLFLGLWMTIVAGMLLHETLVNTTSDTYRTVARWFAGITIGVAATTICILIYLEATDK